MSTNNAHSADSMSVRTRDGAFAAFAILSRRIAVLEGWVAGSLVFAIFLLLIANVVCRSIGVPLIWVDELAVLLMVWAAFVGASMGLAHRQHIAVTLLPDALGALARRRLAVLVDVLLLVFLGILSVQLWNWFDPVTLWRAGSVDAFSNATFNFVYREPTVTLGVPKYLFWLILPIFCVTSIIHVIASLSRCFDTQMEALT